MVDNTNVIKAVVSCAVAYVSDKLGILLPVMTLLCMCMAVDFVTGWAASLYEKAKNPDNKEYGVSSKKGSLGILKKASYLAAIFVGVGLDWLVLTMADELNIDIGAKTFFGLMVAVWFIMNEMLSIIENVDRMGVSVPSWLKKFIKLLKGKVDDAADTKANSLLPSSGGETKTKDDVEKDKEQ